MNKHDNRKRFLHIDIDASGYAHFKLVRPSIAKYTDGKQRKWQGLEAFTLKIFQ